MKHTVIPLILALAIALPAKAGGEEDRRAEVLDRALAGIASGGAKKAAEILEELRDPAQVIDGYCRLVRLLYWERKDLRNSVALAREGIRTGLRRASQAEREDPARAADLRSRTKGLAFDLASFTWPGWAQEGIEIGPAELEAGLKAARLNLDLAKQLEKPPDKMSAAYWVLGAQLLSAGELESALKAFLTARECSAEAGDALSVLLQDGYMGIALRLRGERKDGENALRGAIRALESEGSDDGKFYAGQLRTAYRVFVGDAEKGLRTLTCGPLTLQIHLSRTAQLFHIVDQISEWSPLCRKQYLSVIPRMGEARRQLELYADFRMRKGWGGGLEQTFYTTKSLDRALFDGVAAGHLTNDEMLLLRDVLTGFSERVDAYLMEHRPRLLTFAREIDAKKLADAATELGRLLKVEHLSIPCYLVPCPGRRFGGGFNGGLIVLEVPPEQDPQTVLIHEIAHAFLMERAEEIGHAAREAEDLDVETLHEAIAYAFAQGLHSGGEEDFLAKRVAEHRGRGEGLEDRESGARYRIYGLFLRPAFRRALESGSLEEFLSSAVKVWMAISESLSGK